MPEEYSTLRAAVERIMGAPGGGSATTAGTRGGGGEVALAPRAPFSDVSSISNVIPEAVPAVTPMIQQAAPVVTQAVQAAIQPVARAVSNEPAMISQADLYSRMALDQKKRYENALGAQGALQGAPVKMPTWAPQARFAPEAYKTMMTNPYAAGSATQTPQAAVTKPALTKPVNPGSRAPWQASAQYWKDLDAYKRAGGA